jgi:peptidoglycan/LPS O-acetylase OafA/YrhL
MMKPELPSLTSFRFVAAAWILMFHLTMKSIIPEDMMTPGLYGLFSQGALAMSLFFILSGFILAYNYGDTQPINHYWDFVMKRLARIYPAYAVVAVITTLPLFFQLPLWKATLTSLVDLLLLQAWFPPIFFLAHNKITWSLSVEMTFYVLFPLLIFLLCNVSTRRMLWLMLACFGLFALSTWMGKNQDTFNFATYIMPFYRLPEFVIGVMAGLIFLRQSQQTEPGSSRLAWLALPLGLGLVTLIYWLGLTSFGTTLFTLLVIPVFTAIIYLLAWAGSPGPGLLFLGRSSYSFYLMQAISLPVYHALQKFFPELHVSWSGFAIVFCFNLLLASACYLGIETPARKRLMAWWKNRSASVSPLRSAETEPALSA